MKPQPNLLAGEDFPPEPQQKRSADKRARLKAAGLTLFAEKGYEGASVDEIARTADLAVGTFYQHYRSKRQLLLALMSDLLEYMSKLDLRLAGTSGVEVTLRDMLHRAFSGDLKYLGAYRAWQEAILSDPDLARKDRKIHSWTIGRVTGVFELLAKLPGARKGVDIEGLGRVMDSFFWSLLSQAVQLRRVELERSVDSATHLIYHALFIDR
ncbi:MAG TPA: helix-turn-helix domain-containing protein [Blastocatellia bacterium]|nr:helix-turn-helix domain-containing protein [Blastocatellia bacterium]